MVRSGWSTFETDCVDKVNSKEIAASLSPTTRIVPTAEILDIPRHRGEQTSTLRSKLLELRGKNLVAKPTHSSGAVLFLAECPSDEEVDHFLNCCTTNLFYRYREAQYHRLPHRIIVEEMLPESVGEVDFKFHCSRGAALCCEVITDRRTTKKIGVYTVPNFDCAPGNVAGFVKPEIERPTNFDTMISAASELSVPFDYVRIDLYTDNKAVYFGEFTFSPGAAMDPFEGDLGTWLLQEVLQHQGKAMTVAP